MDDLSNRREAILHCAHSLILAGGYNGFSYADISKVVGIRNAIIHHHFPTKSSLVRTLVAQYREGVQTGIAELERRVADPLEKLLVLTPRTGRHVLLMARFPFVSAPYWQTKSPFCRKKSRSKCEVIFNRYPPGLLPSLRRASGMLSARPHSAGKIFGVITHPLLERLTP